MPELEPDPDVVCRSCGEANLDTERSPDCKRECVYCIDEQWLEATGETYYE